MGLVGYILFVFVLGPNNISGLFIVVLHPASHVLATSKAISGQVPIDL